MFGKNQKPGDYFDKLNYHAMLYDSDEERKIEKDKIINKDLLSECYKRYDVYQLLEILQICHFL